MRESTAANRRMRAALPPDVRKVCDLPASTTVSSGLRPNEVRSPDSLFGRRQWGKAATAHRTASRTIENKRSSRKDFDYDAS